MVIPVKLYNGDIPIPILFQTKNGPPIDVEEEMLKYLVPVRDGRHDRRKTGLKPPVSFLYRVS